MVGGVSQIFQKKEVSVLDTVAVISASGRKLMPTNSYRARRLLKSKRAVIYKYRPVFTIKLVDRTNGYTQPIEYKCDTGYQNIGISICSDTKEFVNEQRNLLKDEVKSIATVVNTAEPDEIVCVTERNDSITAKV